MITKRDNILIYPYSYKTFPTIKLLLDNNYNVKVTAFDGLGLIGKDVSYSVNRYDSNRNVLKYSEDLLEESDVLYIPEFNEDYLTRSLVSNVLKNAIKKGKRVIAESNCEIISEFSAYDKLISLQNLKDSNMELISSKNNLYKTKFYRPTIPVIYIGGVHDLIDNDYITITLKNHFEERGYKVCCLTRNNSSKLFGCISFPEEFININISIEDKIINLNNYIKFSIENLEPDVLIIQVPYGMIQFNDYYHNTFGSYAYLISQAIKADYFICCMTTELLSREYYNELSQYFHKRYDSAIDCVHFSNCLLDIPNSTRVQNKDVLFLNEKYIDELLHEYKSDNNYKMLNLFNNEDFQLMYNDILYKL